MVRKWLPIFVVTVGLSLIALPALAVVGPTHVKADQLHQTFTDVKHRYQLTVQGRELSGETISFQWQTDCGQFYQGQAGKSLGNSTRRGPGQGTPPEIVWGYDLPKDCSDAVITVAVEEGSNIGFAVTQKVFAGDSAVTIERYQPKHPSEERKIPFLKKLRVYSGFFWGRLLDFMRGRPEDPERDEVPGGVTGVRG